jgi:hypothetical protein
MEDADKSFDPEANRVIDAIGGTAAVAKLCEVNMQAVSQWRRNGIPAARRQFLRLACPDAFDAQPSERAA